MSVDALNSFEWLKLWTSLPQLFVAKDLSFNVTQFACHLFLEMYV